jgi:hypothetical protein
MLRHRFELRLALMAMVGLVIAQLGAVSHAYAHDTAVGSPSLHLTGTISHDPCGDCLAYAPLLSAAGGSASLPFLAPALPVGVTAALPDSLIDGLPFLAFRSRAPPYTP